MRRIFVVALFLIFVVGCKCPPKYPVDMVKEVIKNSERIKRYNKLKTTRAQDKRMLKASEKAWGMLAETMMGGE